MEGANDRSDNPYTQLEGYRVSDASGEEVGEIEDTVYDAPSDVLKYVVVRGRVHPRRADRGTRRRARRVSVPYERGDHRVGAGDRGNSREPSTTPFASITDSTLRLRLRVQHACSQACQHAPSGRLSARVGLAALACEKTLRLRAHF